MAYEDFEQQRKSFHRRWALNCACVLTKDLNMFLTDKAEKTVEVAKIFMKYFEGD